MKGLLLTAISLISLLLFISLFGFYFAIRPIKISSSLTPASFGVQYENVSFTTKDNVTIRGWWVPNKNPKAKTIILLHGYPADKGNILPATLFLHQNYHLLYIDFRYLGESGGNYSTAGKNEVLDVLAALDYLKSRGIHEVGIFGFSLGGSVALMAAEQSSHIKAIAAEAPYSRLDWMAEEYYHIPLLRYPLAYLTRLWGLLFLGYDIKTIAPAKSAETLKIPLLFFYSKNDDVVSFRHAELMQTSTHQNPNATFIIVDDMQHGRSPDDFKTMVKTFFDKNF